MRSRVLTWSMVCGIAASFSGCAKSDEGAAPIARADLAAKFADIYCRGLGLCCGEAALSFDPTECRRVSEVQIASNLSEIDSSKTDYDAQAAGDCLALYDAVDSCGGDELEDADVCARIFVGRLAPGQPCDDRNQCAHGPDESASCDGPADGTSVCRVAKRVPLSRGKRGAACSRDCDVGASCDRLVSAAVPGEPAEQPSAGDGVACHRADNLYCAFPSSTCEPLVALGQACSGDGSCAGNAFCDFETGTCKARLALGEVCESVDACAEGECLGPDDSGTRSCATRVVSPLECSMYFDD